MYEAGCERHPGAPVDLGAPPGASRCLFCNTRRASTHRDDAAPVPTATGCERHPGAPVDTDPPPGAGHCLFCNRSNLPAPRDGDDPTAFVRRAAAGTGCHRHPGGPVEPDPGPGQGPCMLCNRAQRPGARETADANPAVSLTAGSVPTTTGCHRHPGGPVDHTAPRGWGICLLCNGYRRRGLAPGQRPPELVPAERPRALTRMERLAAEDAARAAEEEQRLDRLYKLMPSLRAVRDAAERRRAADEEKYIEGRRELFGRTRRDADREREAAILARAREEQPGRLTRAQRKHREAGQ